MKIPRPLVVLCCMIPWIVASLVLGWLVLLRYPVNGIFVASSVIDGKSAWINPFLPSNRVSSPGVQPDGWIGQRIVGDPVYFTARVPGPYDSVDVAVEYRPVHQSLLEFGLVRDAAGKDLELAPMYAAELQTPDWQHVAFDGSEGYVRNGIAPSRLSYSHPEGLAVWDATATSPLLADPDHSAISTVVSLRGSHDFYFVPAGGSLHVTFAVQAANRQTGSDAAGFRIFRDDKRFNKIHLAQAEVAIVD